jgi:hypothetical protein
MAGYTIKNLMDVEDSAGKRAPGVERVAPQTVRAFEAGDDGLEVIAVGSDRPEGGDGVMADSAWPDEAGEDR